MAARRSKSRKNTPANFDDWSSSGDSWSSGGDGWDSGEDAFASAPSRSSRKKRRNSNGPSMLILVAAVVVAFLAGALLFGGDDPDDNGTTLSTQAATAPDPTVTTAATVPATTAATVPAATEPTVPATTAAASKVIYTLPTPDHYLGLDVEPTLTPDSTGFYARVADCNWAYSFTIVSAYPEAQLQAYMDLLTSKYGLAMGPSEVKSDGSRSYYLTDKSSGDTVVAIYWEPGSGDNSLVIYYYDLATVADLEVYTPPVSNNTGGNSGGGNSGGGSSGGGTSTYERKDKKERTYKCTKCRGTGKISCSRCGGAGHTTKTKSVPNYSGNKKGSKRVTTKVNCSKCSGSGKVYCGSCGGDGKK